MSKTLDIMTQNHGTVQRRFKFASTPRVNMALVDPWGDDSDSESTLSTGGWVAPREDIERYRGESTVVPQATLSQNTQGKVNDGSTNNPFAKQVVSLAGGGSVNYPDFEPDYLPSTG